jgi:hypothetical protein
MLHKAERVELEMKIIKYRQRAILFAADDGWKPPKKAKRK